MSDEAAPGPSARSVERLATDVGGEVADLRTRLHRALDEADRLEAEGRQDLAAAVLEEQREALFSVHQRLQGRLADAAVEREAERVVAEATPVTGLPDVSTEVATSPTTSSTDPVGTAMRLLAAVAAAAAGVALLVTPELGSAVLTVAGLTTAEDPEARDAAAAGPTDHPSTPGATSASPVADAATSTQDVHDAVASDAPARAGVGEDRADDGASSTPTSPAAPGADKVAGVTDLAGLVQQWIDGLTDADRVSPDEERAQEAEAESPPILPVDGSDDAEPDDPESDDERVLDGR